MLRWLLLLLFGCCFCSLVVDGGVSDLPWGDVNVLFVTDVHSWVNGHGPKEDHLDVDYGSLVSFHNHLRHYARTNNLPLFFVMNGDFMDGTGLSRNPPHELMEILVHMPWDALNAGNHELYKNSTITSLLDPENNGLIPHFGNKYLTSNIVLAQDETPLGSRYTVMESTSGNTTTRILTYGFLYHMEDPCPLTKVLKVEDVLVSDWFQQSLVEPNLDGVLVLAHMDVEHPLVFTIHQKLRDAFGPDFPIQFVTGHTHYRGFHRLDNTSTSVEAGRYLDTIGFLSFPNAHTTTKPHLHPTVANLTKQDVPELFQHRFLNASLQTIRNEVLAKRWNFQFFTREGRELQRLIHRWRRRLGLLETVGCLNETLYVERGLQEPQSLWGFYLSEVVPDILFPDGSSNKVLFQNSGSFRYDFIEGRIYYDDLIAVSPFNDTIHLVADGLTGLQLKQILGHEPNTDIDATAKFMKALPETVVSHNVLEDDTLYELYTVTFELSHWSDRVENVTGTKPQPIQGDWSVTLLWEQYVAKYMVEGCPHMKPLEFVEEETEGRSTSTIVVGSILVAIVLVSIVVCCCIAVKRLMQIAGYRTTETTDTTVPTIAVVKAMQGFDDDDDDDDHDLELL